MILCCVALSVMLHSITLHSLDSFLRNITIFGIHFLSFYFLQLPAFFGQFVCKRSNKIVAPSFVYMPSLSSEFLSLHEIKKGSWLCRHKIHGGKIYDFFVILFPAFFKQGSRKIKFWFSEEKKSPHHIEVVVCSVIRTWKQIVSSSRKMLPLYTIIGSPPHFTGGILSWRRKCKENIFFICKACKFLSHP